MFNKIWAGLLAFSGVWWLINAVRIVYDHSYHPDKFTLVIAFVITGFAVLKWAVEAWDD